MPNFDYNKGFVVEIKVVPVHRVTDTDAQKKTIHAQLSESFVFGRLRLGKGQILCALPESTATTHTTATINTVTCKTCRKELDRWSRDAQMSKCKGYALSRDGRVRAVAAKSNSLAATLLGVNQMYLLRNGISGFNLNSGQGNDELDYIRRGLATHGLGVVIEQSIGEDEWVVVLSEADADVSLLAIMSRQTNSGNTAVKEVRKNRSIRLTENERTHLKKMGGIQWIRAQMNSPSPIQALKDQDLANTVTVIRATDNEWKRFQNLGGTKWLRSEIYIATH